MRSSVHLWKVLQVAVFEEELDLGAEWHEVKVVCHSGKDDLFVAPLRQLKVLSFGAEAFQTFPCEAGEDFQGVECLEGVRNFSTGLLTSRVFPLLSSMALRLLKDAHHLTGHLMDPH